MPPRFFLFSLVVLTFAVLGLTACGRVVTPEPPPPPTLEAVTLAPRVVAQLQASPSSEAAAQQPTTPPTQIPATEVPPTDTPTPVPPTATPTAASTATPLSAPAAAAAGDIAAGEALFRSGKGTAPACITCHNINQNTVLLGPSMVGIAARAAERVEGLSAAEYLAQSIVEPNAYIVPNTAVNVFSAGGTSLMFQQYGEQLTQKDVDDLVAYMLSLP